MVTGSGLLAIRTCALIGVKAFPLPEPDISWASVANALLGKVGISALPVHCGCAVVAALVHGYWNCRCAAVGCLVGSTVAFALSASTGLGCSLLPLHATELDCPELLEPVRDWYWPLCGGILWAALTGAAAWRQLGFLHDWESSDNFWRNSLSVTYAEVS